MHFSTSDKRLAFIESLVDQSVPHPKLNVYHLPNLRWGDINEFVNSRFFAYTPTWSGLYEVPPGQCPPHFKGDAFARVFIYDDMDGVVLLPQRRVHRVKSDWQHGIWFGTFAFCLHQRMQLERTPHERQVTCLDCGYCGSRVIGD